MSEQSEIIKEEDINININNDKINNNEDKINNNNNNKIQKYNQHQVINKQKLLDKNGNIQEPGYAFNQVWEYSRKDIKASNWRIKEWDYYYIGNQDCGLCLTLSDIGYVGCLGASFVDFKNKKQINKSKITLLPLGSMNFPSTPDIGDIIAKSGKIDFSFLNDGKSKHLKGTYPDFYGKNQPLIFDILLTDIPRDSMVIATPFHKPKHFYYNQKTNGMKASGFFTIGDKEHKLDEAETPTLGTLDWGRGVWTYSNTWYWGSFQGILPNGIKLCWNIGYGFGDTSAASENMLFVDGIGHKLDQVTFHIPKKKIEKKIRNKGENKDEIILVETNEDDYLSPWKFSSNDGRFEMDFEPILDRVDPVDLYIICLIPHQVFGKFSGKVILDDGKEIIVENMMGFAEKVHNKW